MSRCTCFAESEISYVIDYGSKGRFLTKDTNYKLVIIISYRESNTNSQIYEAYFFRLSVVTDHQYFDNNSYTI